MDCRVGSFAPLRNDKIRRKFETNKYVCKYTNMRSGSISYFSNLIYLLYLRLIGLVMSFSFVSISKGNVRLTPEQIGKMLIEELLLLSSGNDRSSVGSCPQRIRPPSVGNRGSIHSSRSPTHRIGHSDLDHSKVTNRPSTPTRENYLLPDDHPQ